MSNFGGTAFRFIYANLDKMENKRDSYDVCHKDHYESPPEYDSIIDADGYEMNNE